MATIEAEKLRKAIKEILDGADLSSLSAKKVRRQLEEEFDADFTHRKKEIDDMLMEEIEAAENGKKNEENGSAEDSGDSEDESPSKKAKKAKKSESSDDEEEDDEEVARKLQEEEEEGGRRTRNPKKRKQPTKTEKKPRKNKGLSVYSRPCQLSPILAEVMGTDQMARKDVVKNMWAIVKERKLQDPDNKQFMICDDQLQKLFGRKRVKAFGMMKYLKDHITQAST